MQVTQNGRFCNRCRKDVYDLSNKNTAYFIKILQENNQSICGKFSPQQLLPKRSFSPYWKKLISTAMLFIGLGTFSERLKAQDKSTTQSKPKNHSNDERITETLGMITMAREPEFPGGKEGLKKFIIKNFNIPSHTPNGTMVTKFIIQKNGSLTDIQILKGITVETAAEIIRVLKCSPKWNPSSFGSQATSSSYILNIIVKDGKII